MRPLLATLLVTALLAGCSGKPPQADLSGPGGPGAQENGLLAFNVTSPSPAGAPYVRDYAGVARDDPASFQGLPTGPAMGPMQTCCLFTWVDASDLFAEEQLAALRLTLTWTNTATDQANLDVAACVPWFCGFGEDLPDQTHQTGTFTETIELVSGGHRQALDNGQPVLVGVRYSNGVFAAGVPFTVHAEVVPVRDALALLDPYEVVVPPGGELGATLHGPLRGDGVSAGIMVYGEDDRPLRYHVLSGADGSRHALGHGAGSYVVVPFEYDGAFASLHVGNLTEAPRAARRLQESFATVDVAAVADPAPHAGSYQFDAPPGSLDTFPYFLYDAASLQMPGALEGSSIRLTSSSGVVADVEVVTLGMMTPIGQSCFTCMSTSDWNPENYVDDDGAYTVDYSGSYATGRFVLFTATYSR